MGLSKAVGVGSRINGAGVALTSRLPKWRVVFDRVRPTGETHLTGSRSAAAGPATTTLFSLQPSVMPEGRRWI
jgi:hypothetical protein